MAGRLESACGIGAAGSRSTEVNHGGQILLPLERDLADPLRSQRLGDLAIEQRRSQLDGMARQDPGVETVEPARFPIVPRAVLDHHVVVNAIALRLAEGPVGNLVHANRARGRLEQLQGIPRQLPAPVGPCHGIPPALDLRQRSQKLRSDDRSRMLPKERFVFFPGLDRALVE